VTRPKRSLLLGRNTEALWLTREAMDLSPDGIDGVRTDMVHGQVLLRMGELAEAEHHLELARGKAERILDGQIHGPLYAALVEVNACQGDLAAALALAEEGTSRLLPAEDAAYCMMLYAAASSAAADHAIAEQRRTGTQDEETVAAVRKWVRLAEQAMARSATTPVSTAYAQVAQCELARASGLSDALEWADAAARWDEVGEPYRAALARLRKSEALLADSRADRPAAQDALQEAWQMAQGIGAKRLQAEIADLARRARIRLAAAETSATEVEDPLRLTPREQEVLRHVAAGMTDRQIGERLFISHRTVERHVSNLLAKTGVSRRAELVALAHR
jgi:DNA-binding CsgD family transcriptional regulator